MRNPEKSAAYALQFLGHFDTSSVVALGKETDVHSLEFRVHSLLSTDLDAFRCRIFRKLRMEMSEPKPKEGKKYILVGGYPSRCTGVREIREIGLDGGRCNSDLLIERKKSPSKREAHLYW